MICSICSIGFSGIIVISNYYYFTFWWFSGISAFWSILWLRVFFNDNSRVSIFCSSWVVVSNISTVLLIYYNCFIWWSCGVLVVWHFMNFLLCDVWRRSRIILWIHNNPIIWLFCRCRITYGSVSLVTCISLIVYYNDFFWYFLFYRLSWISISCVLFRMFYFLLIRYGWICYFSWRWLFNCMIGSLFNRW